MFGPNDFDTQSMPYQGVNGGLAPVYVYDWFADGLTQASYTVSSIEIQVAFPQATSITPSAAPDADLGLLGTAGTDLILGFQGHDVMDGGDGDDLLFAGMGNDKAFGGKGNDWIYGHDGDDILSGWKGDDILHGGAGNDQMHGGSGHDTLYGEDGNDVLKGGGGNDWMFAGIGDDRLIGGNGNDFLLGDLGDDVLKGGGGRDVLVGASEDDVLTGGGDADVFVFRDGFDLDTIKDFDLQEGDVIDLQGNLQSWDFAAVQQVASQTGNHVTLDFGNGDELVLRHHDVNDLSADYFTFA